MYTQALISPTGMMTPPDVFSGQEILETDSLRAIVRGEMPLENFKSAGVAVHARRIEGSAAGLKVVPLAVHAEDLAEGMLNLKSDAAALSEWASFVLVMSELFAFSDDEAEYCDRLIAAIWDIAFGKPLTGTAIRLAATVRSRKA